MQESTVPASRYKWWQAPLLALYSRQFYVDVAKNWSGTGIGYMFLLCTASVMLTMIPVIRHCNQLSENPQMADFLNQIPQVTLNNGKLSINKPCPYRVRDFVGEKTYIEFRCDQTGVPAHSPKDPPIIITQDAMILEKAPPAGVTYKGPDGKLTTDSPAQAPSNLQIYKFADFKLQDKLTFDGHDLLRLYKSILSGLPLATFFFAVPFVFIGHLLQLLLYGTAALLLCSGSMQSITYSTGLRLAAMAMTANVLLCTVLTFFNWAAPVVGCSYSPLLILLSIIIELTYLFIAASAYKAAEITPNQIVSG